MSYGVSITEDGTVLDTAGKYLDQDIVVGMSDSIKKPAATYTPGTTDQTIPAGKYLSGAQTIKGDPNLIAENIRSGKSIFGVAGSLTPGITPSGTKNITENGTYDVTQYASAAVNVAQNFHEVTFNQPLTVPSGNTLLVSNDQFFKAHRSDANAVLTLIRLDDGYTAQGANFVIVTNREFTRGDGSYVTYGAYQGYTSSGAGVSNFAQDIVRWAIASSGPLDSSFGLFIDTDGNLRAHCISNRRIVGNYKAVLTW